MTGKTMPLRERDASTIQAAADAFVSSPRYANLGSAVNRRPGPCSGLNAQVRNVEPTQNR
jgi:hypothetical protein